jgi:hypothetical protein
MPDPALKPASPVLRSHRLDYAPPPTAWERIARHLPRSDSLIGFLKTLVWVAPLTLLIWVYAEREQNVKQSGIIVPIEVRTSDPNRIVTLRGPADKNVVLELYGPRAKVDHIRDYLKPKPDEGAPLVIDIDPKIAAGENKPSTIEQINNNDVFKNNGITVISAQPPYLVVAIDTYADVDVPVRPSPEAAKLLSGKPHFTPETVKLRAPKSVIDSHPDELFVYADLANREDLRSTTTPAAVKVDAVRLYWGVSRENVHISPATVAADLAVKPSDIEFTIPSVPISKESPALFDKDFAVSYTQFINNVVVTGPREQIELMQKNVFKPKAVLEVSILNKDLGRGPLKFELPPGVTLTPESAKKATWDFTVTPR